MLNHFKQILDIAGVILLVLDHEGNISLINKKGLEVLGYHEEELLGKNWFRNCLPEEQTNQVSEVFHNQIEGNIRPFEKYENTVLTKNGQKRLIAWDNTMIRDEQGSVIGTLSSGLDITERRQVEDNLIESERKHRDVVMFAPIGIYQTSRDGKFIAANSRLAEILGYDSAEELMQANMQDDVYWDGAERKRLIDIYEPGESVKDLEVKWKRKDGSPIWISLSAHAVKNSEGTTRYFEGFVLDISERKKHE